MPLSPKEFADIQKSQYDFDELFAKFDEQLKRGPRDDIHSVNVFMSTLPEWVSVHVCQTYQKAGWREVSFKNTGEGRDASTVFIMKA